MLGKIYLSKYAITLFGICANIATLRHGKRLAAPERKLVAQF
jgi:hypothetical protein